MADIFISYAHQDGDLAKEISPALEAAGYTTWYYEDKGAIGASYLLQIDQEIERCQAVIVLISPESVASDQVSKEVAAPPSSGTSADNGAWLSYRRDARGAPLIGKVALSMLVTLGLWLLVALSSFTGSAAKAAIPDAANRSALVRGAITAALIALVPAGMVFALFRRARKPQPS